VCSGDSNITDVTPVTEPKSLLNISSRTATPRNSSKTTPTSGSEMINRLVDISGDDDDDDVAMMKFGQLKVGFTPGMDGKSRRVRVAFHITACS